VHLLTVRRMGQSSRGFQAWPTVAGARWKMTEADGRALSGCRHDETQHRGISELFLQLRGGGQGQDRTADLRLFRGSFEPEIMILELVR
jgi:hypothetical protein